MIAAEPELGDLVYGLRSLEEGFIPPIFDPAQIDRKFLVNSADSLRATRMLTEREGIFAGISSGAVIHVAQRIAAELESGDIVCLLADGGLEVPLHRCVEPRPGGRGEGRRGVPVVVARG